MSINASIGISLPGGSSTDATFELRAGALFGDQLAVKSFRGEEGVSRLYRFDVVCLTDLEVSVFEAMVLGKPAVLTMHVPGGSVRVVYGIVASVRADGEDPISERSQYRLRIVPRMWLLRRRKTSRIFQDQTVVDVVNAVLAQAQVPCKWTLKSTYPKRTYCVQYQETDFAFVTRLLAEEGIFFFFDSPAVLDAVLGAGGAGLATEAAGVVGAAAGAFSASAGAAVSSTAGGLSSETVVFCDGADMYPPMANNDLVTAVAATAVAKIATFGTSDGGPLSSPSLMAMAATPAPVLPYRPLGGMRGEEHISTFDVTRTIRSKAVYVRDYDFRRPLLNLTAQSTLDPVSQSPASMASGALSATISGGLGGLKGAVASAAGDALADATTPFAPRDLEVYEHHGEYEDPEVQRQFADTYLEQLRSGARVAHGASNCRRVTAGQRFLLQEHSMAELDCEWTAVRVEHVGVVPGWSASEEAVTPYENRFHCVPADVAYRPPRPKRRVQQVLESALVVGPPGEEIYTDEFGRIKVQFHWDRQGQKNENSSCWIRVAHAWAGASWGFQFIPRIGMEVLVTFLGGDEDRPIIMGAVYNQTHPAPFHLPREKTRSGIRTQSTPQAHGGNEISFEDAAGNEQLFLQAQRDMVHRVMHDDQVYVGHDLSVNVGNNLFEQVEGERLDSVIGNVARSVGGTQTVNVVGDHQLRVGGRTSQAIDGTSMTTVNGSSVFNLGAENRSVQGFYSVSVGTEAEETGYAVSVNGPVSHEATQAVTVRSKTKIVLEVGDSSVVIGPDSIHVAAKKVILHGTDSVTVLGDSSGAVWEKKIDLTSKTVNIYSKGGVIELDENAAKIDGPQVVIGTEPDSPPEIKDEAEKAKTQKFKWKMLDHDKLPYANKTYVLVTQGFKTRATTDGDGVIDLDIPKDAFLAEIDLWTDKFPDGPRSHYTVRVGDIPPASVPAGAQIRLKNLGYYLGKEGDSVTPEVEAAVKQFQRDNGLEATGQVDGKTASKLDEVHPT